MFKKITAAAAFVTISAFGAEAAVFSVAQADFVNTVVESFDVNVGRPISHDFGNGMTYRNTAGSADYVGYTGGYGMGSEPSISGGRGGSGGYLGTYGTPTSFVFEFAQGISQFGFFGAESAVSNGSAQRNGILDLVFYDLTGNTLDSIAVDTKGTHAWSQFHGFGSDTVIGSVAFMNVGHMVLDDVQFTAAAQVPLPASGLLLIAGLGGIASIRRKS